jgi:HlyD family secretion protein
LREGDAVWVVDDGRLQSRPVRLGLRTLQSVEVLQGLAAGEQVALGDAAQPGQRVRPQAAVSPPASAATSSAHLGDTLGEAMRR